MMTAVELLPSGATTANPAAQQIAWSPDPGSTDTLKSDIGWYVDGFGAVADEAVDLLRIAVAAYVTDRLAPRPTHFSRDLHLTVHLRRPDLWLSDPGRTVMDILAWLTGDTWELTPVQSVDPPGQVQVPVERRDVMLLSGGLDSFSGAVDHAASAAHRLHVGHRDASTAVRHAQNLAEAWFCHRVPMFSWTRLQITQTAAKREPSTRTRSLLFMALAIAAASGTSAREVIVPENGFTSINLPLQASRGGALSTKSTHPWTFYQVQRLTNELSLNIAIHNPYAMLTKGELVRKAADSDLPGIQEGAARTLSCSKLDGGRLTGGNATHNCGLCIACIVRRGAFIAAGVADDTPYLINEVTGEARTTLIARRRSDLIALKEALASPVDEVDLIASAAWPADIDLDEVLSLCERGRKELSDVPLP
ncbi:hypothetical protein [Modestobacter sp. VKM Ac-2985]|uniref:hypothetical protein n=1 Tax=Modestobacter sp. VKM Ac-2985 TaxID=3004139 RepID=UPI0022ABABA8|nr:hypothetical protein [Modestobacter sp. VKM Ac-2985]MCZ2836775.1 hypothetical protein [Modestobacter sp. VKM Ac-2985]